MLQIFKYPLPTLDSFSVFMPTGAKILDVQMQYDRPVLWALIDEKQEERAYRFRFVGTGYSLPDDEALIYVATVQTTGNLVWHLFEVLCSGGHASTLSRQNRRAMVIGK